VGTPSFTASPGDGRPSSESPASRAARQSGGVPASRSVAKSEPEPAKPEEKKPEQKKKGIFQRIFGVFKDKDK
jgi:hypothetical protein